MTDHLAVTHRDLAGLTDVPAHIRESLVDVGLPASFERFEIDFTVVSLRTAEREGRRILILGEAESGAIVADLDDGSVWWLQREIAHPPELRSSAYRQFVNSSIPAFVRCAEACTTPVQDPGPDAAGLAAFVRSVDAPALEADNEGVWRDVVLDWDAGL